tara:strand:+ start:5909 stop:7315 length:1407 start_codon:yes stop_codon:yes gene_type:complete
MNINQSFKQKLIDIVGSDYVIVDKQDMIVYESDGTHDKGMPDYVTLPGSVEEVSKLVILANDYGIPIIARGSGTGLSGGAVPISGGLIISVNRMNKILNIDPEKATAELEAGVINLEISKKASEYGLFYAPDPSSQQACSIGGNVAENSGGPHCLAYGVTTNHILAIEVVLPTGEITWFGEMNKESSGIDFRGLFIGSEGTFGICTKVVVKLLKQPEEVQTFLIAFNNINDAANATTSIIGSGIIPSAIEMMDRTASKAAEEGTNAGIPENSDTVLLIEIEGFKEDIKEQELLIKDIVNEFDPIEIKLAANTKERDLFWKARKGVLGALGRIAPNYFLVDGTVPRTKLSFVLSEVNKLAKKYGLIVANVLHAGDGNLHPCIIFDQQTPGDTQKALSLGGDILKVCVENGGVLSGEHGIGYEKKEYMPLLFSENDINYMKEMKNIFDSKNNFNPGKIFPEMSDAIEQPK